MVNLITEWIASWGAPAVGLLMFLENVFPPIPSEVVMPIAGVLTTQGELSTTAVIIAGTLGSVAGASFWYIAGRALGISRLRAISARHGHWLTIQPRDVDTAQDWFRRRGHLAVLFGRLVPAIRTLISIPAGVAAMRWLPFLVFSTIGSLIWISVLTLTGVWLGERQDQITGYLSLAGNIVMAALVVWYLWRVFALRRHRQPSS